MTDYNVKQVDSMIRALREHPEDFSPADDGWPTFRGRRMDIQVIRELPDDLMAVPFPEQWG